MVPLLGLLMAGMAGVTLVGMVRGRFLVVGLVLRLISLN
jgi:hypothetical protein